MQVGVSFPGFSAGLGLHLSRPLCSKGPRADRGAGDALDAAGKPAKLHVEQRVAGQANPVTVGQRRGLQNAC